MTDFKSYLQIFLKRSKRPGFSKTRLLVVFIVGGMPLLLVTQHFAAPLRQHILDVSVSTVSLIEKPYIWFKNSNNWFSTFVNQGEKLRTQEALLQNLRAIDNQLLLLKNENKHLKELLKIPALQNDPFCMAPCVGKVLTGDYHVLYVQAGSRQGIAKGQPVLAQNALIGIIDDVGLFNSRVLLLTDGVFQVPVRGLASQSDGIVGGEGDGRIAIRFLQDKQSMRPGEAVVTSGIGGTYPPDLLLGYVEQDARGQFFLSPASDLKDVHFVKILFTQLEEGIEVVDP